MVSHYRFNQNYRFIHILGTIRIILIKFQIPTVSKIVGKIVGYFGRSLIYSVLTNTNFNLDVYEKEVNIVYALL